MKLRPIIIILLVALTWLNCTYKKSQQNGFDIYYDTIMFKNSSKQTEFIPHVSFRINIVNKGPDTLLLVKNKKQFRSSFNDYFEIKNSINSDGAKLKLRSKYFLPLEKDYEFRVLSPDRVLDNKIIILPFETGTFDVYRNYYYPMQATDSLELYNYLKNVKISYSARFNIDSLKKVYPNYKIIEQAIIKSKTL